MKNLFHILLFIGVFSSAQVPNTSDLSTQGYNTGCHLASTHNLSMYNATINNGNFPQEYKDGVRLGWMTCPHPVTSGSGFGLGTNTSNDQDQGQDPLCDLFPWLSNCIEEGQVQEE